MRICALLSVSKWGFRRLFLFIFYVQDKRPNHAQEGQEREQVIEIKDLIHVRDWAHPKITTDRTLPWTWEHYTQLVKTLDVIIDGLENTSTEVMAEEYPISKGV